MLPREFAHWKTVYHYFRLWRLTGLCHRIHDQLRDQVRVSKGRHICPSAAIVEEPERGHPAKWGDRGYDACKHTKGRKRHIVVDVFGLILAVPVTGANVQDRDGGQSVLKGLKDCFPRVARVWADGAYAGRLVEWAEKTAKFVLDIVCKPKRQIGFSVLPWRWIVDRTFAWLGNYRRLARDYEISPRTSEAWIKIAMIHLMLRRLA
jgi:transposase